MYQFLKIKARNLSYSSSKLKTIYSKLNGLKTNALKLVNDDTFAQIKYWEATGKHLDLKEPKTFNEKLWWLKFNYRHPLMTQCSDKVKVRDYIRDLGLEHILTDIEGVYLRAEDIPFDALEGKFFIKCNHVSGINTVYDSNRPDAFNYSKFIKEFNSALSKNYYYQSREWNYKNIEPRIIVEKFIETKEKLLDYKIFCFHGEAKLMFVDMDVAAEDGKHNPYPKRNIYDKDFILQDFTMYLPNFDESLVEKPKNLSEMIKIAEKIAEPFPFCRVDLYNNNDDIKFGEVTFYTGGGTKQFSSEEADQMVASWIKL